MNKKLYSFADEVKRLKKKYKRAEYDEVEKKELIEELRKLRDEQESFRADAGMDEEDGEDQMPLGGVPNLLPFLNNTGITTAIRGQNAMSNQFGPIKSSILPSAISTGVSLIGNIMGMNNANKRADESAMDIPRMAAEQISLAPQREDLRRSANTATNVALRNSRDVSSPGAAYANQVAGVGSIYDSLGSAMGQSYMTEQNTNAQMRQQANEANLSSQLRGNMFNAQMKAGYQEQADQYRDAAFQAVPQGLQDFRAQRSQDQWMSQMGKDYGLYQRNDPSATFGDKLYNSLFGTPYSVQNREYINSLNRRR